MGQSNGVLSKDATAFHRCPSVEVSLYVRIYVLVISCPGVLQQKYSAD